MTEETALTKWCPMVRASISQGDGNASNRDCHKPDEVPAYAQCIGSKCMMWRRGITEELADHYNRMSSGRDHVVAGPYCGLAGKI